MVLSACLTLKWDYGLCQIQYKIQNFTISVMIVLYRSEILSLWWIKCQKVDFSRSFWFPVSPVATKIEKNVTWALRYSIDQEFHVDDENTRESQFSGLCALLTYSHDTAMNHPKSQISNIELNWIGLLTFYAHRVTESFPT
jgi:hypothetical protein